eukprot:Colp12_sorted_trinity150504_noHs@2082
MKLTILTLALLCLSFVAADIKKDVECEICQIVVGEVDHVLTSNQTLAMVDKRIDEVCNKVPKILRGECIKLVNKYANELIVYLVERNLKPTQVCSAVKACDGPVPAKGFRCILCEIVVTEVEKKIDISGLEKQVVASIESNVCSKLPKQLPQLCDHLVDNEGALILERIRQRFLPTRVCAETSFCPSA